MVGPEIAGQYQALSGEALKTGSILPQRLKIPQGELWLLPQWLKENGDKDAMDIMTEHQRAWQSRIYNQGMLKRLGLNAATSNGLVYEFMPHLTMQARSLAGHFGTLAWAGAMAPGSYGPAAAMLNEIPKDVKESPLGDLVITPAPNAAWRLDLSYWRMFSGGFGRVMRLASLRYRNVTAKQAFELAANDFRKRSESYLWQTDPYAIPLAPQVPGKSAFKHKGPRRIYAWLLKGRHSANPQRALRLLYRGASAFAQWIAGNPPKKIPRAIVSGFYGLAQMNARDAVQTIIGLIAANALIVGYDLIKGSFDLFILGGRLTGQTAGNVGSRMHRYAKRQEEILREPQVRQVMKFLTVKGNNQQDLGSRLNIRRARMYLSGKDFKSLGLTEDIKIYPRLTAANKIALKYIMDSRFGRFGSQIGAFDLGKQECLRVDEPTGLSVEHLVGQNICFATFNDTGLRGQMPQEVRGLFKAMGPQAPYLMIRYDREKKELVPALFTQEQYQEVWNNWAEVKPRQQPSNAVLLKLPIKIDNKESLWDIFRGSADEAGSGALGQLDDYITKPLESMALRLN